MNRKILWVGVVAAVLGCIIPVLAEDTKERPVLTVLGESYTATDLGAEGDASAEELLWPVIMKIRSGVIGAYLETHDFKVTEEELKEFYRRSTLTDQEMDYAFGRQNSRSMSFSERFEDTWEEWQKDADDENGMLRASESLLREWKCNKSYFNRYGGRVKIDQFAVPHPVDAIQAYYAECEARGDYMIHDEALKARCDETIQMATPYSLVSEEEGRKAFAEHPADWQKRLYLPDLRERMDKAKSQAQE